MANSSQSEQQSIILKHLQSHVSVRQFMDSEVTVEQERVIVSTATRSATSSNLHSYSIISVRNSQTKERISDLSGNQEHIRTCGLFLVFCADLYRLSREAVNRGYPYQGDTTEALLIATVDAALAADRALIAAQAIGLGGVMVGAIRNNPDEIAELLRLPRLVYAVMGMSIGHPAKIGPTKPRIPLSGLLHQEHYEVAPLDAAIREYDETVATFGHLVGRQVQPEKYPNFSGDYTWSEHSSRRMADDRREVMRPHMREFLQKRGFMLR